MIYSVIRENHNEQILNEYAIHIPKAWARGEADSRPTNPDDVVNIPHYELRIEKQIGTSRNRRDTYVYYKLPKSGKYIAIVLHMNGGVSFKPDEHKLLIRETDELDRRIILGFCKKHQWTLKDACYEDKENFNVKSDALCYKASDMPKRIKQGSENIKVYSWGQPLEPYEEEYYINSRELGMFSGVQFLNT